jgi:hypothetical protein
VIPFYAFHLQTRLYASRSPFTEQNRAHLVRRTEKSGQKLRGGREKSAHPVHAASSRILYLLNLLPLISPLSSKLSPYLTSPHRQVPQHKDSPKFSPLIPLVAYFIFQKIPNIIKEEKIKKGKNTGLLRSLEFNNTQ